MLAALQSTSIGPGGLENVAYLLTPRVGLHRAGCGNSEGATRTKEATHHGAGEVALPVEGNLVVPAEADAALFSALDPE